MYSNESKEITQAGNNPATGSDRVQAPVAGAGSMDSGRSQQSLPQDNSDNGVDHLARTATSEDIVNSVNQKELGKLVERHGKMLESLASFIQQKKNLHKEIHRWVPILTSTWKGIEELVTWSAKPQAATTTGGTQTTPTISQAKSTLPKKEKNDEAMDVDGTSTPRRVSKARRRKRGTPTSIEGKELKKRKQLEEPLSGQPEEKGGETSEQKWQTARKKERSRKISQKQPQKKPQKPRERPNLPNALVIHKKGDLSYAEILSRIKKDPALKDAGECVQKVRRTNAGDLLIVLNKESSARAPELRSQFEGVLGESATVQSKAQEVDLEIRDLEENATKEEISAALQRVLGPDYPDTEHFLKSLRKAYGETQTALIRLVVPVARKLLDTGTIRVGWCNCRIREVVRPLKCYKCWKFGHLSRNWRSVDRAKDCIKCGNAGHKVAECTASAKCVICAEAGDGAPTAHIAGSSRCPAYMRALQALRVPQALQALQKRR